MTASEKKELHEAFLQNWRAIVARMRELAANDAKASKAIESGDLLQKGKKAGIGEVRTWKGKKYRKFGAGDWRRVFDNESRGAKNAYSRKVRKLGEALKGAKDDAARNAMCLQFALENRALFQDEDGYPLPMVQKMKSDVEKWGKGEYRTQKRAAAAAKRKVGEAKTEKKNYRNYRDMVEGEMFSDYKVSVNDYMNLPNTLSEKNAKKQVSKMSDDKIRSFLDCARFSRDEMFRFALDKYDSLRAEEMNPHPPIEVFRWNRMQNPLIAKLIGDEAKKRGL